MTILDFFFSQLDVTRADGQSQEKLNLLRINESHHRSHNVNRLATTIRAQKYLFLLFFPRFYFRISFVATRINLYNPVVYPLILRFG